MPRPVARGPGSRPLPGAFRWQGLRVSSPASRCRSETATVAMWGFNRLEARSLTQRRTVLAEMLLPPAISQSRWS